MKTADEAVAAESAYQRAAAEWVARHNRTPESGVSQLAYDGQPNAMTQAENITDVTFAVVGQYFYSEMTQDLGGVGITYTLWERASRFGRKRDRAVREMEIRWYDYNAGRFVEECVAILNEKGGAPC